MIKIFHLSFVALSFLCFVGKVIALQISPELLKRKPVKITPHIVDTLLLLSGITLVFQGSWFSGDYSWLVVKLIVLVVYIGLGIVTMRTSGTQRYLAFSGAVLCFVYIAMVAVTKNPWGF